MRLVSLRSRLFAAVLLVGLAGSAGCDDNNTTSIADACMTFDANAVPSAGTVVARQGADSTCDVVQVELVATDINGVFGAAWTLDYDNSFLLFSGFDVDDSHLASDGNVLISNFSDNGGTITFGVNRNGSQSTASIDFTGQQLLATIFFTRLTTSGNSDVEISMEQLLDNGQPPVEIPTPGWAGGRLVIN